MNRALASVMLNGRFCHVTAVFHYPLTAVTKSVKVNSRSFNRDRFDLIDWQFDLIELKRVMLRFSFVFSS